MVHTCEAGKDVYVEKPLGWTIGECLLMAEAAERYDRVVQGAGSAASALGSGG